MYFFCCKRFNYDDFFNVIKVKNILNIKGDYLLNIFIIFIFRINNVVDLKRYNVRYNK